MDKKLKIVTFNVHFGKNTKAIADALTNHENLRGANVLLLQEIEHHQSEIVSRAEKLADALGMKHAYVPARGLKNDDTHGLAILSKYDLADVSMLKLPLHSLLYRSQQRIAMTAIADIEGTKVKLANIHLDTRLSSADRIAQMKVLVDDLKKDHTQKMIVGGDFNMLPFYFYKSVPFFYQNQKRLMHKYLREQGFSSHCENGGYTLKSGFIKFELDGIYTRNVQAIQCGVEHSVMASDHKPVWLDVNIAS